MAEVATLSGLTPMETEEPVTTKPSDFQPQLDVQIPQNKKLASSGRLEEALENLLLLEKQTRLAADLSATSQLCLAIVQICFEVKDWKALNAHIVLLAKRRAQLKQAITKYVQEAMTYLDHCPDKATKYEVIEALRTVTDGKIYVEAERAKLTRIHSAMKEEEGKIDEAAKILQEIQPETFGSLDRREKTDFILDQIRLCLDTKDYVRASVIAKKINTRVLNEKEYALGHLRLHIIAADTLHQDLKIKFYEQMVRFHKHNDNQFEISQAYRQLFESALSTDDTVYKKHLKAAVIYLVMSEHSPEQYDMMLRLHDLKQIQTHELATYKALLKAFVTTELIAWGEVQSEYRPVLAKEDYIFSSEEGAKLWEALRVRVVEHNIRVICGYYNRITMKKLSTLLDLSVDDAEKYLSEVVVKKALYARIDRPAGIVVFARPIEADSVLNDWRNNIADLLGKVDRACHLITKETMQHMSAAR